jgi:hypothetical protein
VCWFGAEERKKKKSAGAFHLKEERQSKVLEAIYLLFYL